MELGLFQKQSLNIVMTPSLRQAINLLQYSTVELSQFIREEALDNPLIELEERTPDITFEEQYEQYGHRHSKTSRNEDAVNALDFISDTEISLAEHLLEQIRWLDICEQKQDILRYLILNLDENGYLPLTVQKVAAQLDRHEQLVSDCIQLLQQLEPTGVGASNLKECLMIQAKKYYSHDRFIITVIRDYLELLAERRWQPISQELNISLVEVRDIFEIIQTLNPKPGASISNIHTQYINPDIMIEKDLEGYSISMNDTFVPTIHLSQHYRQMKFKDSELDHYFAQQHQRYIWLMKSIEQRRKTIIGIVQIIIEKQQNFLKHGLNALQPMTLKDIADELNMHESTVSRATTNKFIRTPVGTFDLRVLFTSKLEKSNGSNVSSTQVKALLKQMIEKENKRKPYSDQKIAELLKEHKGILVSRRTIAKYRDELNILPSSKRRSIV